MNMSENSSSQEDVENSISQVIKVTREALREIELIKKRLGAQIPSYIEEEHEELSSKLERLLASQKKISDDDKSFKADTMACKSRNTSPYLMSTSPSKHKSFVPAQANNSTSHLKPPIKANTNRRRRKIFSQVFDIKDQNVFENLILISFPNEEVSIVPWHKNVPISTIMMQNLKIRNLTISDSSLVYTATKAKIPWDVDSAMLAKASVSVIIRPPSAIQEAHTTPHQYESKVFIPMCECHFCHTLVMKGYRCKSCQFCFHKKCIKNQKFFESCLPNNQSSTASSEGKPSSINYYFSRPPCFSNNADDDTSAPLPFFHLASSEGTECYDTPLFHSFDHDGDEADNLDLPSRIKTAPSRSNEHINKLPDSNSIFKQSNISGISSTTKLSDRRRNRGAPIFRQASTIQDWEINSTEVIIGPEIGSGSYGTVFKANWHGFVAVKMLKVNQPGVEQLEAFRNEVNMLRRTRHINILLFMGCIYQPALGIVTQWCDGSTLYKHIHILETDFDQRQILDYMNQIAHGMEYLHARSIIHRDLKSNNIFLQDGHTIKIGDFGLATAKSAASVPLKKGVQPTGSILWMAPEIIRMDGDDPYTYYSDVYSYGIVLYELLTYELPYSTVGNADQILYMVGRGILKPDLTIILDDINRTCVHLLESCIKFRREERPLFPQVVSITSKVYNLLPSITRTTSCVHIKNESNISPNNSTPNILASSLYSPFKSGDIRGGYSDQNLRAI